AETLFICEKAISHVFARRYATPSASLPVGLGIRAIASTLLSAHRSPAARSAGYGCELYGAPEPLRQNASTNSRINLAQSGRPAHFPQLSPSISDRTPSARKVSERRAPPHPIREREATDPESHTASRLRVAQRCPYVFAFEGAAVRSRSSARIEVTGKAAPTGLRPPPATGHRSFRPAAPRRSSGHQGFQTGARGPHPGRGQREQRSARRERRVRGMGVSFSAGARTC